MDKIHKRGTFLVLVLLFLNSLASSMERFQVGVSFNPGFPVNEFRENVNRGGLGGSGDFMFRLKGSPLSLGVSFGVIVYGSDSRQEWFSAEIPEVMVDVRTRNSILTGHFLLRLQSPKGKIRPYLDGLVGFHYLWTETGVYDRDGFRQKIASDVNLSDWTWSYGLGGGLLLPLYEKKRGKESGPFAIFLDFSARYLKGGKAEYLKEGSIIQENERVIYDVSESTTDLIAIRAGLSFAF
jgi:hypothetical protein